MRANLTVINLDDNQIRDVSVLSGLTSLGDRPDNAEYREGVPIHLALQNNSLSDIVPLVSNIRLDDGDSIGLLDNPLSEDSLGAHILQLQASGVEVLFTPPPLLVPGASGAGLGTMAGLFLLVSVWAWPRRHRYLASHR